MTSYWRTVEQHWSTHDVLILDLLAEQRIAEAMAQGAFDDLPGAGRPLELADDVLVPEELRTAYRLLKRAGFVPPEVESLREIAALERVVFDATDDATRARAARRLSVLRARLAAGTRGSGAGFDAPYLGRLLERLEERVTSPCSGVPDMVTDKQRSVPPSTRRGCSPV